MRKGRQELELLRKERTNVALPKSSKRLNALQRASDVCCLSTLKRGKIFKSSAQQEPPNWLNPQDDRQACQKLEEAVALNLQQALPRGLLLDFHIKRCGVPQAPTSQRAPGERCALPHELLQVKRRSEGDKRLRTLTSFLRYSELRFFSAPLSSRAARKNLKRFRNLRQPETPNITVFYLRRQSALQALHTQAVFISGIVHYARTVQ